ncbi:MAG: ribosome maturation factor RimM [Pseudomonadota bacterium]
MAQIGAPHGVRGAVKLTAFTEAPLDLRRYNPFSLPDGRTVRLLKVEAIGKGFVARIEGVDDRDAAGTLTNQTLSVPRARLPRPDEDEFYHVDLIGLTALWPDGRPAGTVRAVHDFGAGELLEIAGDTALMVPFTRAAVPTIDFDAGTLTIDPPETVAGEE